MTYLPGGTAFSLSDTIEHETELVVDRLKEQSIPSMLPDHQYAAGKLQKSTIITVAVISLVLLIFISGLLRYRKRRAGQGDGTNR